MTTASEILEVLENTNFSRIFETAHEQTPEEFEDNLQDYAVMYDMNVKSIFMLPYATPSDNWAKIAEQQNPWIHLGYLSAEEIIVGDPSSYIEQMIQLKNQ